MHEPISVSMEKELIKIIDDVQHEHRYKNRSDTICKLLKSHPLICGQFTKGELDFIAMLRSKNII